MTINFAAVKAANASASVTEDVRKMADGLGVDLRTVTPRPGRATVDVNDVVMAHNRRATAGNPAYDVAPRAANPSGPYTGASGLPAFTASGIDPKSLLASPAPVRPAIAAAPTPAEAYAIAQRYAGMTDERAAEVLALDMNVPPEVAHAWASANNVDVKPKWEAEQDTHFASAEQSRIAAEKRNREYRASIRDGLRG